MNGKKKIFILEPEEKGIEYLKKAFGKSDEIEDFSNELDLEEKAEGSQPEVIIVRIGAATSHNIGMVTTVIKAITKIAPNAKIVALSKGPDFVKEAKKCGAIVIPGAETHQDFVDRIKKEENRKKGKNPVEVLLELLKETDENLQAHELRYDILNPFLPLHVSLQAFYQEKNNAFGWLDEEGGKWQKELSSVSDKIEKFFKLYEEKKGNEVTKNEISKLLIKDFEIFDKSNAQEVVEKLASLEAGEAASLIENIDKVAKDLEKVVEFIEEA